MGQGNQENNKSANYNTSRSMGNYGSYVVTAGNTLDLTSSAPDQPISAIVCLSGATATVSGDQTHIKDETLRKNSLLPSWSSVALTEGTYITSLVNASVAAAGGTVIVYFG